MTVHPGGIDEGPHARPDMVASVRAGTMNEGTADEFVRILLTCPLGHDLGSISVGSAMDHPFEIHECRHYEHRRA